MLLIAIGFLIGMLSGAMFWEDIAMWLVLGVGVLIFGAMIIITLIYWRKNKASKDKKYSDVSEVLMFNALAALLLYVYLTWRHTGIFNDGNTFLLIWMAINLGALRVIWTPGDDEAKAKDIKEDKKEEDV
jgi:hypothetical protein